MKLEKNSKVLKVDNKVILYNVTNMRWYRFDDYIFNKIMDENNEVYNKIRIKLIEDGLIDDKDKAHSINNKKHIDFGEKNSVFIKITNNCNLACEFCCESCSNQILDKDMNISDFKLIFNKIKTINTNRIIITGGEPLINSDALDILKYCKQNCNSKIILSSNGLLINKKNFEDIVDTINFAVFSVENLFESQSRIFFLSKFKKLIEDFQSKSIGVTLSFVITKKNKRYVLDFIQYCNELNVGIALRVVAPMGKANNNEELLLSEDAVFNLFIDIYKYIKEQGFESDSIKNFVFPEFHLKESCSAGRRVLSVNVNGDINACHSIEHDDYIYGNVCSEEISQISNSYKRMYSKLDELNIDENVECKNCDYKYFCGGNCYAELLDNENMGKKIMCKFYKKLIPYILACFDRKKDFKRNLEDFINYCNLH